MNSGRERGVGGRGGVTFYHSPHPTTSPGSRCGSESRWGTGAWQFKHASRGADGKTRWRGEGGEEETSREYKLTSEAISSAAALRSSAARQCASTLSQVFIEQSHRSGSASCRANTQSLNPASSCMATTCHNCTTAACITGLIDAGSTRHFWQSSHCTQTKLSASDGNARGNCNLRMHLHPLQLCDVSRCVRFVLGWLCVAGMLDLDRENAVGRLGHCVRFSLVGLGSHRLAG